METGYFGQSRDPSKIEPTNIFFIFLIKSRHFKTGFAFYNSLRIFEDFICFYNFDLNLKSNEFQIDPRVHEILCPKPIRNNDYRLRLTYVFLEKNIYKSLKFK